MRGPGRWPPALNVRKKGRPAYLPTDLTPEVAKGDAECGLRRRDGVSKKVSFGET